MKTRKIGGATPTNLGRTPPQPRYPPQGAGLTRCRDCPASTLLDTMLDILATLAASLFCLFGSAALVLCAVAPLLPPLPEEGDQEPR